MCVSAIKCSDKGRRSEEWFGKGNSDHRIIYIYIEQRCLRKSGGHSAEMIGGGGHSEALIGQDRSSVREKGLVRCRTQKPIFNASADGHVTLKSLPVSRREQN